MIVVLGFLAGVAAVIFALGFCALLPLFDDWFGEYGSLLWLILCVGVVGALVAAGAA